MKKTLPRLISAGLGSLVLGACVSAPPQTVELSDVVLQQVTFIEKAHRDLVRAYFVQLEREVNGFIDREWIPDFLDRVVRNPQVQQELRAIRLGQPVDASELKGVLDQSRRFTSTESQIILAALAASEREQNVRLSTFMTDFSDAAMQQINQVRAQWRQRLRDSERQLMGELDESYATLRSGHLQIRSYLESVVDIRTQQDRIAQKIGLLEERDRSIDAILALSDSLANGRQQLEHIISIHENSQPSGTTPPIIDGLVLDRVLKDVVSDGLEPPPLGDDAFEQTLRDLEQTD